MPIFEPGLDAVVARTAGAGRLSFTTDAAAAIADCQVIFLAVGTPLADDGSADLTHVEAAARAIGQAMDGYRVIVNKSTVPVGTGRKLRAWIAAELAGRGLSIDCDVVANPEFLREGSAVHDFMHPDRVVLGVESDRAREIMRGIYRVLYLNGTPFIETGLESAEMIKYAANALLAVKITYINEIANLCGKLGADVKAVAIGMGKDSRIGSKFLQPGPGYGGSCLPKDTRVLADMAARAGSPLRIVEAAIKANGHQQLMMVDTIQAVLGGVQGKRIAVLGLAYKPDTADMRDSPALAILEGLVAQGATVNAYDPAAMAEARWRLGKLGDAVRYSSNEYDTMPGAAALVILTEWNQFRNLDLDRARLLL
jgi:UDPglucose 6-dehydrogenase